MPHRIALLIHALYGGGAEKLMSQLAARWAQHHKVHLITWSRVETDQYAVPDSVHRVGLDLMRPSRGAVQGVLANLARVRTLRRTLRSLQPDLILSFADQMNILSLEASRPLGIPHWISEHSNPEKQKLGRFWESWRSRSYPRCAGCHCLTDDIAQYMSRWIEPARFRVIPPAIDVQDFPDMRSANAQPSQVGGTEAERTKTFVFVGRLSEEKAVSDLLDAWRKVQPALADWKLVIAGDGPLREQLERQAAPLQGVEFLGWVDDPAQLYRNSAIFVLPSNYEGFPVALLEAMSCGLACIATDCSSAVRTLASQAPDGAALRIVPTHAVAKLAEALRDLALDPVERSRFGTCAMRVAQFYSWSHVGPRWDAILRE